MPRSDVSRLYETESRWFRFIRLWHTGKVHFGPGEVHATNAELATELKAIIAEMQTILTELEAPEATSWLED